MRKKDQVLPDTTDEETDMLTWLNDRFISRQQRDIILNHLLTELIKQRAEIITLKAALNIEEN